MSETMSLLPYTDVNSGDGFVRRVLNGPLDEHVPMIGFFGKYVSTMLPRISELARVDRRFVLVLREFGKPLEEMPRPLLPDMFRKLFWQYAAFLLEMRDHPLSATPVGFYVHNGSLVIGDVDDVSVTSPDSWFVEPLLAFLYVLIGQDLLSMQSLSEEGFFQERLGYLRSSSDPSLRSPEFQAILAFLPLQRVVELASAMRSNLRLSGIGSNNLPDVTFKEVELRDGPYDTNNENYPQELREMSGISGDLAQMSLDADYLYRSVLTWVPAKLTAKQLKLLAVTCLTIIASITWDDDYSLQEFLDFTDLGTLTKEAEVYLELVLRSQALNVFP